jgi:hypothetical protein
MFSTRISIFPPLLLIIVQYSKRDTLSSKVHFQELEQEQCKWEIAEYVVCNAERQGG